MKLLMILGLGLAPLATAQNNFAVTGTAIPPTLLQQNYGRIPKEVTGYDLNICNVSASKQSIVSSEIYQALSQSTSGLQPIGRQIMLATILRSQSRSKSAILTFAMNSMTGALAILTSAKLSPPSGVVTGVALGAVAAQQVLTNFKPLLTSDQVEKFESEVLEPALVLDSGSCVERTIFAASVAAGPKARFVKFHAQ